MKSCVFVDYTRLDLRKVGNTSLTPTPNPAFVYTIHMAAPYQTESTALILSSGDGFF